MQHKLIIAIDGYSSTGKSTLAKHLAGKLGYTHIDSGAMYRAVTLYALQKGWIGDEVDKESLLYHLSDINIGFHYNQESSTNELLLNGENVESQIRDMRVSNQVSRIAKIKEVRTFLVDQQRKLADDGGVVMDGRDIGTTVFPFADIKIFLIAGVEERAKRRFIELQDAGKDVTFEEVKKNIADRDFMDENRSSSPLQKAADAIEIDNGTMTREQTFAAVWHHIISKFPSLHE